MGLSPAKLNFIGLAYDERTQMCRRSHVAGACRCVGDSRQQPTDLPRLCKNDLAFVTFLTLPQDTVAIVLKLLSVHRLWVLLSSNFFLYRLIARKSTRMDQRMWRKDDFQVCVTVRKTYALADTRRLACKHATIRLGFCIGLYDYRR